ncbi:3-hydroxyacyl-CoA dehydrogenase family protein [Bacillus carboniphilus]|uniref:3-hydroxyacyl-CoA dehydrogenase family protein n=1 Tax=Bacillus carboniphilus TaxID=86663 RepID=A0ABY9JWM5_9BACI|nr:3-hydroxyacyl-CoA dehydrogenase family protein [Bacillus carboniphilus]WLR43178.1 3-hydroxyacyl-CoA dehydrogenase family protein [Bacillus carboniphilus]
MKIEDIDSIAVIGAGQMGHQIAMLCCLGGFKTFLYDKEELALKNAKQKLDQLTSRWIEKQRFSEDKIEIAYKNLIFTTNFLEAVSNTPFIIEAVVEKLSVKQEVFRKLDECAPKEAILATNSSTIVNSLLAEVTNRKEKVINMHFFFPPVKMDCVEIVKSDQTSQETTLITEAVCDKINRSAVVLEKEISGFVANRILGALQKEAVYLYENGYASFEDIDLVCKKALNHPLGPFELMDLSGIDVGYYVMQQRYEETGDPLDKPFKCLEDKVKKGHLGRKTGKGFYQYSP